MRDLFLKVYVVCNASGIVKIFNNQKAAQNHIILLGGVFPNEKGKYFWQVHTLYRDWNEPNE